MSSSEDNEAHPAQSTRTSARAKRGRVLDSDESDEQDEEHADGYAFLAGGAPSEDIKQVLLDVCSRLCTAGSGRSDGSGSISQDQEGCSDRGALLLPLRPRRSRILCAQVHTACCSMLRHNYRSLASPCSEMQHNSPACTTCALFSERWTAAVTLKVTHKHNVRIVISVAHTGSRSRCANVGVRT